MPLNGRIPRGAKLRAAGYGQIEYLGKKAHRLLEVYLDLVTDQFCNSKYDGQPKLPEGIVNTQICTISSLKYPGREMDTCLGFVCLGIHSLSYILYALINILGIREDLCSTIEMNFLKMSDTLIQLSLDSQALESDAHYTDNRVYTLESVRISHGLNVLSSEKAIKNNLNM